LDNFLVREEIQKFQNLLTIVKLFLSFN